MERFISGGLLSGSSGSKRRGEGRRPAVLTLHGADGLTMRGPLYRTGAQAITAIGCHVALVHYLDRAQERWASLATAPTELPAIRSPAIHALGQQTSVLWLRWTRPCRPMRRPLTSALLQAN
jgi:hypothetical protein